MPVGVLYCEEEEFVLKAEFKRYLCGCSFVGSMIRYHGNHPAHVEVRLQPTMTPFTSFSVFTVSVATLSTIITTNCPWWGPALTARTYWQAQSGWHYPLMSIFASGRLLGKCRCLRLLSFAITSFRRRSYTT